MRRVCASLGRNVVDVFRVPRKLQHLPKSPIVSLTLADERVLMPRVGYRSPGGMPMTETRHDAGDANEKQEGSGDQPKKDDQNDKGRPDKGGTAGQSGGEQAKNRSSNPESVKH
jgi:hypothetical protein